MFSHIQLDPTTPIDQKTLTAKMKLFLSVLGEKFPLDEHGKPAGQCGGDVFMLLRADDIGEGEHYIKRKYALAAMEDEQIIRMADLYNLYKKFHRILLQKKSADLKAKLNENEKLEPHLQENPQDIEEHHYAVIRNEAKQKLISKFRLKTDDQFLLNFAEELYYYIHSLIAAQTIEIFNLHDKNEESIQQKDYLQLLDLLPTDRAIYSSNNKPRKIRENNAIATKQVFEFAFNFTDSELMKVIDESIFTGDRVCLSSTDHVMYFRKQSSDTYMLNFNFFDPNNETSPPQITSTKILVQKIKEHFFTNFNSDASFMPIFISAFNKEDTHQRPTASHLLEEIFKARGAQSNINAKSWDGVTALFLAAQFGCTNIVKDLIARGADINSTNENGETAAIIATRKGYDTIIEALINTGADINQTHRKQTLLEIAIFEDRVKAVDKLLSLGADINFRNAQGATMLYFATLAGNPDVIKIILEKLHTLQPKWSDERFVEITKKEYLHEAIIAARMLNELAVDIKNLPEESDPSRQFALDALKKLAVDTWQNSGITFEFAEAYQNLQRAHEAFTKLDKINKSFSAIDDKKSRNNDSLAEIKRVFEKAYSDNDSITEIKCVFEKAYSDNDAITEIKNALKKAYFDFATNPSRCESIVNELQNSLRCIYHEVVKDHKTSGDLRFFGSLQDRSTLKNLMEKAAAQCNLDLSMENVSPVKRLSGSI